MKPLQLDNRAIAHAESAMGIPAGSIGTIAWLLLQEMAGLVGESPSLEGIYTTLVEVAKGVGLGEEDALGLIQATTGEEKDRDAALVKWQQGVLAIRVQRQVVEKRAESGWDEVEAVAIEKALNGLHAMRSNGDPEDMVRIAMMANKALRNPRGGMKGSGRAGSGPGGVVAQGNGAAPVLAVGNLGMMTLTLSPRTAEQIESQVQEKEAGGKQIEGRELKMLDLEATRALVPEEPARTPSNSDGGDAMVELNNAAASLGELLGIKE